MLSTLQIEQTYSNGYYYEELEECQERTLLWDIECYSAAHGQDLPRQQNSGAVQV